MSSADEWRRVCDRLARATTAEQKCALARELYVLARRTGAAALHRRWKYSEDEALDLVHDVLAVHWDEILQADESPKGFFLRVLVNRAIDRHRRRQREALVPPDPPTGGPGPASAALELGRVLSLLRTELSPRDRRVFGARCLGLSAKEVAEAEGLSPANVDQIVSRARARLKELIDADPE